MIITKGERMTIIISSEGNSLESKPCPRFGRSPFFIKYDLETEEWEALNNPAVSEFGGAGVAASQFIINNQATAIISGRFGPNAFNVLKAAGIQMLTFTPDCDSNQKVIELYKAGSLNQGQV